MVEKLTDEITVALPRKVWNGIRGALISLGDRKSWIWENEAEGLSLELEVALQKTSNWLEPEEGKRPMILKFKYFHGKSHVNVAVFAGPDKEHLTLTGRLVLSPLEWTAIRNMKAAEGDVIICEESEDLI